MATRHLVYNTRSQLENKKLRLTRLKTKVLVWQVEKLKEQHQTRNHNDLERGKLLYRF